MARTELPNGIILPAEYSDDWYDDMTSNLSKLDEVIGSDAEKLSDEDVGAAALSNDYTDLDNKPALKPVATSGDYDDLDNKPALKPVATSGDYDDLDNKPALKPVATSGDYDDLDNKPALKPVATSGDYDDLTDLPTYGITRLCSSAITDNSTVAFSAISSTDKIKAGDFLLDTNGKLYKISSVDTANETVSVTTPLTQLAVDANVMHISGNEVANGFKTFDRYIQCNGGYIGNEFSNNARTEFILRSNRDTSGQSGVCISKFRQNRAQGSMSGTDAVQISFDVLENSVRTNRLWFLNWLDWENDIPKTVELRSFCQKVDYRLTHINGINPGVLSFPDLDNGLDISGFINAGDSDNSYTPLVDGYISVRINSTNTCALCASQGDVYISSYGSIVDVDLGGFICSLFIPVVKNVACRIVCRRAQTIVSAKFFPCLGNV